MYGMLDWLSPIHLQLANADVAQAFQLLNYIG